MNRCIKLLASSYSLLHDDELSAPSSPIPRRSFVAVVCCTWQLCYMVQQADVGLWQVAAAIEKSIGRGRGALPLPVRNRHYMPTRLSRVFSSAEEPQPALFEPKSQWPSFVFSRRATTTDDE